MKPVREIRDVQDPDVLARLCVLCLASKPRIFIAFCSKRY